MEIVVVVVRYKTPLSESTTLQSLRAQCQETPKLLSEAYLLVWDNSPEALAPNQTPAGFHYKHSERNAGVAGAFNGALERAESLGCTWLLLLDQDTVLPAGFLSRMLAYSHLLNTDTRVAAIVPFVRSKERLVSPRRAGWTLRSSQIAESYSGIFEGRGFAINSGTLMRVSALRGIGGYSDLFWLDLSDQYVFHRLYQVANVMYVAADLTIQHSIANSDYDKAVSPERYISFLAAENLFLRMFHSRLSNAAHDVILVARAARQYRRFRNKEFARLTLCSLQQRLLLNHKRAKELWTRELSNRSIPLLPQNARVDSSSLEGSPES
jgi:GT2 family glycosyltransferase